MKQFQKVKVSKPNRSHFDLSHERKMSMNMGDLVPFYLQEVLPGDSFRVKTEMLMRLAPMLAPIMHRVNVFTHFFFVPNRLVWNDWEQFITGGDYGSAIPPYPVINFDSLVHSEYDINQMAPYLTNGSLADYLGVPTCKTFGGEDFFPVVSALPFRGYQLIYNEYYRDQNLGDKAYLTTDSVLHPMEQFGLLRMRKRAWEKDYFTSCLPWAQKGEEAALAWNAEVVQNQAIARKVTGGFGDPGDIKVQPASGVVTDANNNGLILDSVQGVSFDGATINQLRRAERIQRWLERTARTGSRYVEQILSHFGTFSSDARLQRPEYLGGGRSPIVISEVLSTVEGDNPQGNMTGHGLSVNQNHAFNKTFEEHGYIFGIVSVIPRSCYQQGLHKTWKRRDKFDYYWPEFAQLGEQEVKNHELFFNYGALDSELSEISQNNETFGYQSRYAEYKYAESSVHGDFKDNMSYWHMGRIFDSQPVLNEEFIQANPTHEIFAVDDPTVHKLYVQILNDVSALRPIPLFNTPTI